MDEDSTDDIALLANTPIQAKSLLHSLEQVVSDIVLHMNADKMKYMGFNQEGDISMVKGGSPKLVDKFLYLGSNVSLTENDINMLQAKALSAIDILSIV